MTKTRSVTLRLRATSDRSSLSCVTIYPPFNFVLTLRAFWKEWDIRNEEQIAECVRHSDIVYNLVGRDYETK